MKYHKQLRYPLDLNTAMLRQSEKGALREGTSDRAEQSCELLSDVFESSVCASPFSHSPALVIECTMMGCFSESINLRVPQIILNTLSKTIQSPLQIHLS